MLPFAVFKVESGAQLLLEAWFLSECFASMARRVQDKDRVSAFFRCQRVKVAVKVARERRPARRGVRHRQRSLGRHAPPCCFCGIRRLTHRTSKTHTRGAGWRCYGCEEDDRSLDASSTCCSRRTPLLLECPRTPCPAFEPCPVASQLRSVPAC